MRDDRPWVTPSELAEHVYCPRALYYRRSRTAPPNVRADAGVRFHTRQLGAELWRERHAGLLFAILGLGIALVGIALAALLA